MDIVIGATPYVGVREKKRKVRQEGAVEARMLNLRYPRKLYGLLPKGQTERRVKRNGPDPTSSRVITLLVPDGYSLPKDAGAGNMKVLMRFVPDRQ